MNCNAVQARLLEAEDPASAPDELGPHLAVCAACREWQRRLVRVERNIPFVPVPPPQMPVEYVLKSLEQDRRPRPAPRARLPFPPAVYPFAGAAAAMLLFYLGWLAFREAPKSAQPAVVKKTPASNDSLVANGMDRNLKLARAETTGERLLELARLASAIQKETRELARHSGPDDLRELAELYRQVVQNGIVVQAGAVPPADRARLLNPVATDLEKEQVALLAHDGPDAADPLKAMAETAREGSHRLRRIMRGEVQ